MSASAYHVLVDELKLLLEPLHIVGAVEPSAIGEPRLASDHGLGALLQQIGWDADAIEGLSFDALSQQSLALNVSFDQLADWIANPPQSWEALQEVFQVSDAILDAVRSLSTLINDPPPSWEQIGSDLITYLTLTYLHQRWPTLAALGVATSVIEVPLRLSTAADYVLDARNRVVRRPYLAPQIRLGRIGQLLTDPIGTLKAFYFGADKLLTAADALRAADLLFPRLGSLFAMLGAETLYGMKPTTYGLNYDAATRDLGPHMLRVKFHEPLTGQAFSAILTLSAEQQGDLGLVVIPQGDPSFDQEFGSWRIQGSITPGVKGFAVHSAGATLIADPGVTQAQAALTASYIPREGRSGVLLGDPAGSFVEIGAPQIGATWTGTTAGAQTYGLSIGTGASRLALSGLGEIAWDSFAVSGGHERTTLSLKNLRLTIDLLEGFTLAGDAHLVFEGGTLKPAESRLSLTAPELIELPVEDFSLSETGLKLTWRDRGVNRWLSKLAGASVAQGAGAESPITLRVTFGKPVAEVRLDWTLSGQRLALPGVSIEVPGDTAYSLIFHAKGASETIDHVALIAGLKQGDQVIGATTFAWGREGGDTTERELQNDGKERPEPLIKVTLTAEADVGLVLADFPLSGGLPTFMRELAAPLGAPGNAALPKLVYGSLQGASWRGKLKLNVSDTDNFRLPFLEQGGNQFIEIDASRLTEIDLAFDPARTEMQVGLRIAIGDLKIATEFLLIFDFETFALSVDHNAGIDLYAAAPYREGFLGLDWSFDAPVVASGPHQGKLHLLTLVTKDYHYQIQQAPGAVFRVEYGGISEEPLGFAVRDFVLRPQGLSLRATVDELPVRLLGIDTKFRFSNCGFEMQDSKIVAFTLSGSGALPPALVGDSAVDIFLNFGTDTGGSLTLRDGTAVLRGNKLLKCKGTRFEFTITKLGIRFVNEGRFHLYFTLSGSAQFRLASTDEREGLLMLLPTIKIEMVDCPLAGDVRVLAKHIKFLITLPRPLSFSLLGCFEMELRGFGFVPQSPLFDGDGAMWLSGQIKFAQGEGDARNSEVDYHSLYIGLPEPGRLLPRIHLEQIVVDVKIGDAFRLYAMVKFVNDDLQKGFLGEGSLSISGLPRLDAAFAFLRVRESPSNAWVRAWFIYAQAGELSLMIPIVQIYIREIGFGLGYRYTLAMIKAADQERDVRKLLKQLDQLAASQGELARISSWQVDLGGPGDPRWTVVLRAMISQNSASPPTSLARVAEKELACLFLFDAVLAFRSDLTFLITARGWLNTNYVDYVDNLGGARTRPFLVAYILLSVPQQRFLARISTTPGGYIGDHPPLPDFIKKAIAGIRFRATLLIEPGLFHLDLGWPNQIGWSATLGPFQVAIVGGFIFRISRDDLVMGVSYMARGTMEIEGGVSVGIAGVRVYARADVAYGMRYIGVLSFSDPLGRSLFYGAMGLELQIKFAIEFWLNLLFTKIRARFSFAIAFSAALEFGLDGLSPGVRGTGSLALKVCGRSFRVTISIAINAGAVEAALKRTEEYLKLGLDADDSGGPPEPVPGTTPAALGAGAVTVAAYRQISARLPIRRWPDLVLGGGKDELAAPHYSAFVQRAGAAGHAGWSYLAIFPRSTPLPGATGDEGAAHSGFFPAPPPDLTSDDFVVAGLSAGAGADFVIEHFTPSDGTWAPTGGDTPLRWRAAWDQAVALGLADDPLAAAEIPLRSLVQEAFIAGPTGLQDPEPLDVFARAELADDRVYNPSERDFEAAVRGAYTQFAGSPFFKHDPSLAYDRQLDAAFRPDTSIYTPGGALNAGGGAAEADAAQHADQMRGMLVHDTIAALRAYVAAIDPARREQLEQATPAFQLGLVFRFRGAPPAWLMAGDTPTTPVARPVVRQRVGTATAEAGPGRELHVFNPPTTSFAAYAPAFIRVRHYTSAGTIAVAWDLTWESPPEGCADEQADPEQHLAHYQVLRRALNSNERDQIYTVKGAQVLNRVSADDAAGDIIEALKPRFQIVDHFSQSAAELAALPEAGLSYLYTITPIDYAGNAGRPLTLIATRYPDRPPRVPTDATLTVRYRYDAPLVAPPTPAVAPPPLLTPETIRAEWTEPPPGHDETRVPVRGYRLIFRRSDALPIGSYGLDSTTQRSAQTLIGSATARPLPTDIIVDLPGVISSGQSRSVVIDRDLLRGKQIFPPAVLGASEADAAGSWRADAWQVFIQAIALSGVPSALAPVALVIEAVRPVDQLGGATSELVAERRPAELEWLPQPAVLPLLPAEDQRALVGEAHFPMPIVRWDDVENEYVAPFDGTFGQVRHLPHPDNIRCVRMRWNQGPSALPDYPLDLTAGFFLAELDIDAHTDATFVDRERLAEALRTIQEVRMAPADDLPFLPRDTLAVNQWEAWYPSAMLRRTDVTDGVERADGDQVPEPPAGSRIPRTAWYSWRESLLLWPPPSVTGEPPWRSGALHPLLQRLVDRLDGILFRVGGGQGLYDALDGGAIPETLAGPARLMAGLTTSAVLRVVSPGFAWRIDDDANDTTIFTYAGGTQLVKATRLRLRRIDTGVEVAVLSPYVVDRQQVTATQAGSFEDLLDATPPKADPYGWGVLQLFGLSATFALRDAGTARPILGAALLAAIHESLEAIWAIEERKFAALKPHLFVEALFQPGRSIELSALESDADRLLANVQVSLRPTIRQSRPYALVSLRAAAGVKSCDLILPLASDQVCDVIVLEESSGTEQRFAGNNGPATLSITIPPGGAATLLIRGDEGLADDVVKPRLPGIAFSVGVEALALPPALATYFTVTKEANKPLRIELTPALAQLSPAERAGVYRQLRALLPANAQPAFVDLSYLTPLAPTDARAARFTAPAGELTDAFVRSLSGQEPALWLHFAAYADAVYTGATSRILAPRSAFEIGKIATTYLNWSQRFFDAAGALTAPWLAAPSDPPVVSAVAEYGPGPWLATAYPRAATPAYATPDAGGRLKYDHLIPDRWAHAIRYYIQPYGRYERMITALLNELNLAGEVAHPAEVVIAPDPQVGGLDVVIDRTENLAAPLVLYSGRLDEAALPGQPVPPGSTWEVIIAQHPEQVLSERNQLLRRRLAYRKIAFTLLRRFADDPWIGDLEALIAQVVPAPATIDIGFIEHQLPDIPQDYPAILDQIDLPALRADDALIGSHEQQARAAERRSLDLPLRVARFQEGALAVQWEGLPFYYEHRLLLVAQADTRVSPISEVTQRDFTYRSPDPAASTFGKLADVTLDGLFAVDGAPRRFALRHYGVRLPLRRLWDSLPAEAQRRWPDERPGVRPYGAQRPFSSLPDPEVIYQITMRFSGNLEVQAEYFCAALPPDPDAPDDPPQRIYAGRRLADRVITTVTPTFEAPDGAAGDYGLSVGLVIYTETPLSKIYPAMLALGPLAFRAVPAAPGGEPGEAPPPSSLLLTAGPLAHDLYEGLLEIVGAGTPDAEAITALHESWYCEEPVTTFRPLGNTPALEPLTPLIDSPPAAALALVWSGPISAAQRDALLALDGDSAFRTAAERLANAAQRAQAGLRVQVPVLAPPDLLPVNLPAGLGTIREPGGTITAVTWSGPLDEPTCVELQRLTDDPVLTDALAALCREALAAQAALAVREDAPKAPDQLPLTIVTPPTVVMRPVPLGALRLTLDAPARRYTDLALIGYLFDDLKQAIGTALDQERPIVELRDAVDQLFTLIETRVLTEQARVRPGQADLPDVLRAALIIDEAGGSLRWEGDAPTDAQQQAAAALAADQAFLDAATQLIGRLRNLNEAVSGAVPPETPPVTVPAALAPRLSLTIDGQAVEVRWAGPVPSVAERTILAGLWEGTPFRTFIPDLLGKLDAARRAALPPLPQAIEAALQGLIQALDGQLTVSTDAGLTSFRWAGRVRTEAQRDTLRRVLQRLQNPTYRALLPALQAILGVLEGPASVPVAIPIRPAQVELPAELRGRLLLGRGRIRYHGLMTADEAERLRGLYAEGPGAAVDVAAIERLYQGSLTRVARFDELYIRARRANAIPSASAPLTIAPLAPAPAPPSDEGVQP